MTTELKTKLDRIESLCRACLELDAKATIGPWEVSTGCTVHLFTKKTGHLIGCDNDAGIPAEANAAFIAAARTLAPATAKSTLTAIADYRGDLEFGGDFAIRAMKRLTEIARHFDV